ncbi:hypothetical protein [Hydrocarboniphaga sp.]|uniref:hypothetical protein n=1 Tax=Hydrocarboniphaga sp. TaxID=2033016 RepID=UPI003D0C6461
MSMKATWTLLAASGTLVLGACSSSPLWFDNDGYKYDEHVGVMSSCMGQGSASVCTRTVLESDGNMPGLPRAVVRDEGQQRTLQAAAPQ